MTPLILASFLSFPNPPAFPPPAAAPVPMPTLEQRVEALERRVYGPPPAAVPVRAVPVPAAAAWEFRTAAYTAGPAAVKGPVRRAFDRRPVRTFFGRVF